MLSDIIKNNINILLISERKLDFSFLKGQFQLYGYSEPYKFDRNGNGGQTTSFIPESIQPKPESQIRIERFFVELNLSRKKWLLRRS